MQVKISTVTKTLQYHYMEILFSENLNKFELINSFYIIARFNIFIRIKKNPSTANCSNLYKKGNYTRILFY